MVLARALGRALRHRRRPASLVAAFALFLFFWVTWPGSPPNVHAIDDGELWNALTRPGHVVLIRHALAPGTGDPAGFELGDCSTQRQLSEAGREQARALGDRMRSRGLSAGRVLSSQWCRCLNTARLLGMGSVEEFPPLNSFFRYPDRREPQMRRLRSFLRDLPASGELVVMVTHQVNMTALTGIYPAPGEMIVLKLHERADFSVLGTLRPVAPESSVKRSRGGSTRS